MSRRLALSLLVVSLVGATLSLYLTYVHYRLHREPGWENACAISDTAGTAERLRRSIDDAGAAGVCATPTVFVNGRKHTGRLDAGDLRCLPASSERHRVDAAKGKGRRP